MNPSAGVILIALFAGIGLLVDRGETKCGIASKPLKKLPTTVKRRDAGPFPLKFDPITDTNVLPLGSMPWEAVILKDNKPVCDGVFIEDPKVSKEQAVVLVLTLASCVDSNALGQYQVISSGHQKTSIINAQGDKATITAVYPPTEKTNPRANPTAGAKKPPRPPTATRTDKAFVVLKLAEAVPYEHARPICLATSNDALGINGLLVGWTSMPETEDQLALSMAMVPVWNKDSCNSKVNEIDKTLVRDSEFYCTPYFTYGKNGSALISPGNGEKKPAKLFGLSVTNTQPQGGIIYIDIVKNAGKIMTYIGKLMNGTPKMGGPSRRTGGASSAAGGASTRASGPSTRAGGASRTASGAANGASASSPAPKPKWTI